MNNQKYVGFCFFDIRKCFDSINHQHLISELLTVIGPKEMIVCIDYEVVQFVDVNTIYIIISPGQRSCWGILVSLVRPSVRPPVLPSASRARSVALTVLVGSISYSYILLIKQLPNVCSVLIFWLNLWIWNFGNFYKLVTLTLSSFDLGSDMNH